MKTYSRGCRSLRLTRMTMGLLECLRAKSDRFTAAADKMAAALEKEG